jgi:hypothetical protein
MDEKRRRNLIIAIIIVAIIAIIANAVAQQQKSPSFMHPAPLATYSPQEVPPESIDNAGIIRFCVAWKISARPCVLYFYH